MSVLPEITMHLGQDFGGFSVTGITPLETLRSVAYQLEQKKSGARIMHLHSEDTENLFSVSFPTPPPDNTGVSHILEHAVLAGSSKYPVKEPFFEMIKMSMATFINAMTGSDCTYYPVASNVEQDLFNLAEVYFDAVFHPLLTDQTFRREGHHFAPLDPEKPTGDLTITGIVYNEMKGVYSSPDSLLQRDAQQSIFPDNTYGVDSGGSPVEIPNLSFEQFAEFHQKFYHPGNSRIFFAGDDDVAKRLEIMDEYLDDFGPSPESKPASTIQWQKKTFDEPKKIRNPYPA